MSPASFGSVARHYRAVAGMSWALAVCLSVGACADDEADAAASGESPLTCNKASEPFGVDSNLGESFPDLAFRDCNGQQFTLDQIRCQQQLTWVSVGAGWCGPCADEAPKLEAAAAALQDQSVRIIQVMFQDAQSLPATTLFCQNWTSQFNLTIDVYIDPVANTLNHFDQAATPLNFVIDRDGKVLWSQTGVPSDIEGTIRSFL